MTSPHRIAFGITELDPGGAERMLTELVTRLDRAEWEPHVYCLGPEAHFTRVLREQGIPVTCFGARGLFGAPRVIRKWTRELRQSQPMILYNWLFHASLLGRIAGRWAGVPHVLSGIRVAERRNTWHGRWDRWTNFLVERNVCVSQGVATFLEQSVGLDCLKTVVIPNAVDGARFERVSPADLSSLGIPQGCRVLITVGRLEHQKGVDVLLAAAPAILTRFTDVHLLIVGDGPDRRALEGQARMLNLAERVHFTGSRHDVPALLKASTALVLPSRWEGMPNVVLEAMAAGKPIVATQVEGTAELVTPGLNGWLVPPEQPQAIAEGVALLLEDSEGGSRMGRESQRICLERFTIEQFVDSHVRLFREILSAPR
ncbi:MAG: glycosyltransferase [Planctomycetales bacterium]